jgi:hypothetical protein
MDMKWLFFSCMTMHLHIVIGGKQLPCQEQYVSFGASALFSTLIVVKSFSFL